MVDPIAGEMHLDPEKVTIGIPLDTERGGAGAQLTTTDRAPVGRVQLKGNLVSLRRLKAELGLCAFLELEAELAGEPACEKQSGRFVAGSVKDGDCFQLPKHR